MMPELAELAIPTSGMSPRKASGDGGHEEGAGTAAAFGVAGVGTSASAADPGGAGLAAAREATTGTAFGLTGAILGDWTTTVGKVTADCAIALPDDSAATSAATLELLLPRINDPGPRTPDLEGSVAHRASGSF